MSYFYHNTVNPLNAGKFESSFLYIEENGFKGSPVKVQINQHSIEFYYNKFISNSANKPNASKILLFIPLNDSKKTDYTLLNLSAPKGIIKTRADISGYRISYGSSVINKDLFEIDGQVDGHSLYELLLCFFEDLNNPLSDIRKYNKKIADSTLEYFSQCELFKLIIKKFSFFKHLHEYKNCNDTGILLHNLKITYNLYLDELLSGKLQKLVPGYYMGKDNWFSTPEEELQVLANLDREFVIEPERFEDIQKSLLSKHEVLMAMKLNNSNISIPIITNLISSCLYLGTFIYWINHEYYKSFWFLCLGFVLFVVGMIIHVKQQGTKLSMILPRIIVSIVTGWFLLIASEEILKNQLNVDLIVLIIGLPLVLILLFVFIFAEIRQHSPYYLYKKPSKLFRKTALIIVYSFNLSVSFGLIAQPLVVNNYILKSKVFEDYIYSDQREYLNLVKDSYINYRNKLLSIQSANTIAFSLIQQQELKNDTKILLPDSLMFFNLSKTNKTDNRIFSIYAETYNNKIYSIDTLTFNSVLRKDFKKRSNVNEDSIALAYMRPEFFKNSKFDEPLGKKVLIQNENRISVLGRICDLALVDIGNRILNSSNVDSLITYNTYFDSKKNEKRNPFCNDRERYEKFVKDSTNSYGFLNNPYYILRYQYRFNNDMRYNIFPSMLIFQNLIVLLLAIVGQLILSDKTITEPL